MGAADATVQSVVRAGADHISIDAEHLTVGAFFKELSAVVPVEYLVVSPEVEKNPVTLKLADVHPVLGVHKFLEKAEVDYAVSGGDGEPFRIIVGSPPDSRPAGRAGNATPSGFEPDDRVYADEPYPDEVYSDLPYEDDPSMTGQDPTGENEPFPRSVTGMAGGVSGVTGPRSATGTATPGGAGTPGWQPPSPGGTGSQRQVPGARPGTTGGARRPPRTITGFAIFVTGGADLGREPGRGRLAATGALLAFGLSLGVVLVRGRDD